MCPQRHALSCCTIHCAHHTLGPKLSFYNLSTFRPVCCSLGRVQASTSSPSKRSVHFEDGETFVWMESGEEEVFITQTEVLDRLESILSALSEEQVPADLRRFPSLREAGAFLPRLCLRVAAAGDAGDVPSGSLSRLE